MNSVKPPSGNNMETWLTAAIILLPGFLTVGLARYIGGLGKFEEFELTLFSLAISIFVFCISLVVFHVLSWSGILLKLRRSVDKPPLIPELTVWFLMLVFAVALFMGVSIGRAYETDLVLKILRKMPGSTLMTKRSSDTPLNLLFRLNQKGLLAEVDARPSGKQSEVWVEIVLESGEKFLGYPELFGYQEGVPEIYLSPACTRKNNVRKIDGPGVVIPSTNIRYLFLTDRQANECHELFNPKKITEDIQDDENEQSQSGSN